MAQKENLNIIDLNDNCLIAILRHLDPKDLFQLAKVHHQFYKPIGEVLATDKSKQVLLGGYQKLEKWKNIKKFFRLFGDKIRNLRIDPSAAGLPPKKTEQLIWKYCRSGNIEICTIHLFHMRCGFIAKNLDFFKSLKSLELTEVWNYNNNDRKLHNLHLEQFVKAVSTLEKLKIDDMVTIKWFLPIVALQTLQVLELPRMWGARGIDIDKLPFNSSVTHLKLNIDGNSSQILEHFTSIHTLTLELLLIYPEDAQNLVPIPGDDTVAEVFDTATPKNVAAFTSVAKMIGLKDLTLKFQLFQKKYDSAVKSFLQLLAQSNRLERFSLDFTLVYMQDDFDEILPIVCKMSNLRSLTLWLNSTSSLNLPLVELAINLKQLRHIYLRTYSRRLVKKKRFAHVYDYDEEAIFNFIAASENLKTFKIGVYPQCKFNYQMLWQKLSSIQKKTNGNQMLDITVEIFGKNDMIYLQNEWIKLEIQFGSFSSSVRKIYRILFFHHSALIVRLATDAHE